jgi:hypothetical protein
MHRSRTLPAVLISCVVVLAGCSHKPAATSTATASSSAASSSAASSSASPSASSSAASPTDSPTRSPGSNATPLPRSQIRAAVLHTALLGRSSATTAEQKAVVQAWMGYWQAVTNAYYYQRAPRDLTRFADGPALESVQAHLKALKAGRNRGVGWARDNVTKVQVTGSRATLRDCTENYTFNVDEEGSSLTRPVPWYDLTGTLEKRAGRWVVTDYTSKNLVRSCLR